MWSMLVFVGHDALVCRLPGAQMLTVTEATNVRLTPLYDRRDKTVDAEMNFAMDGIDHIGSRRDHMIRCIDMDFPAP